MVGQRYQLFSSRDIYDQRILESEWYKGRPVHTQTRVVVLTAAFSMQKIKYINWFLPVL